MNQLTLKQRELALLKHKQQLLQAKIPPTYQPHERQLDFHSQGQQARERLFLAGNRVGKTYCGAMEMAYHLTGQYPSWWAGKRFDAPVQAWAASVTTEATRDILQLAYVGDAARGLLGTIPAGCLGKRTMRRGVSGAIDTLQVRHVSGGWSSLGFKSFDQGRPKFQGTARHVVHLDEEPDIGIYEECVLRTATVDGHIMLTMTPLMGLTPLVESFTEAKNASGKAVVRAGWDDAPHLAQAECNRLRVSLRPHEIAAREQGVPALGSGRVYPVVEAQVSCLRFEIPAEWPRVFGLDFGWTNPTAAVWLAWDKAQDVVYITDCYQASERTPAEHAALLQQRGSWIPGVCDPAGQSVGQTDGRSLLELYAQAGLVLTVAENAVEAGVMTVLERLQQGKLKVFAELDDWWREFRVYRRNGKGRIVKQHDHLMDATRYALVSGLPLATTQPATTRRPRPQTDGWTV